MPRYRNTDRAPRDLADGSIVPAFETVDLTAKTADDPHNAALIADGVLIAVTDKGKTAKEAAKAIAEESQ